MAQSVGTLTIEMAANIARLQRDMDSAKRTVNGAMGDIRKYVDLAKKAIIGLGGVLSVREFAGFVKNSAAAAEQLQRLSFVANTSIDSFQKMSYASSRFGISQEKLADILKDTQDKVGDFIQTGGGAMADFFEKIAPRVGVTAEQFRKLNGREALQLYVSSLEKANLSQADMVFYMEAIASDSTMLLPLLRDNGKAFAELSAQAEKFGSIMDSQTIAASQELSANLYSMTEFIKGISVSIYKELLPGLNAVAAAFIKWAESSKIAEYASQVIKTVFQTIAVVGSDVVFVVSQMIKGVIALAEAAGEVLSGNLSGAAKVFEDYNAQARESRASLDELQAAIMGVGEEAKKAEEPIDNFSASLSTSAKATEEMINAAKRSNEEFDKYFNAIEKTRLEEEKAIRTARETVDQINFEAEALKMTNNEREIAIELRQLELNGLKKGSAAYEEMAKRIKEAVSSRQAIQAGVDEQKKLADEWKRTTESMEESLTDALMRGFEDGKGFGENFKQTLINMFKTMVLRPVLQPIVQGALGAVGLGAGGPVQAAAQGFGGQIAQQGLMSAAGSFVGGQLINAGAALGVGSALGGFATGMGTAFASGAGTIATLQAGSALAATAGGGAAGLGMMAGAALPWVAGALAIGSALGVFGGKEKEAGSGAFVTTRGLEATRELARPIVTGSAADDLFNRYNAQIEPVAQTIVDNIVMSTTAQAKALGKEIAVGIDAGLAWDPKDVATYGYAGIFFGAEKVAQYSNRALGKTFEEGAQKFTQELTELTAKAILDGSGVVIREGQTAASTLEALATSITVVNRVFDNLNIKMFDVSVSGAQFAASLVELFGGIDNFLQTTDFYLQNFYSEAERTNIITRQLTEAMSELGYQLPATRDSFRGLIEAQDLTTESGRQTYAALMSLAPAFASITTAAIVAESSLESVYENAKKQTDLAFQALRRSVDAQKQIAQASADVAREQINTLNEFLGVVRSSLNSLYGASAPVSGMLAAQGRDFIRRAVEMVSTTGYLPDTGDLSKAVIDVERSIEEGNYETYLEMERDRRILAAQLLELEEAGENQLTSAEKQLLAAERQIEQLDQTLVKAQEQLDALRGIDNSIMSLTEAMNNFASAIQAEMAARAAAQAAAQAAASAATQSSTIQSSTQSGYRLVGNTLYFPGGGSHTVSGPNGAQLLTETYGLQQTPSGLIRTRAMGGYTPPGLTIVGEEGPELVDFERPGMVYTASQTSAMMGSEAASEIKKMREENKAQARALVQLQARMTRLLERWDGDGLPEERAVTV